MVLIERHVVKAGLKHGVYYKLYVTQVNKAGLESPKSIPALIRVGDVQAPVVPTLSMDTNFGYNGFKANRGNVDVKVKWTPNVDDDLKEYVLYTWSSWQNWDGDGVKPLSSSASAMTNRVLQNTITEYTLLNQRDQQYLYIGISANDLSNNHSDIYVIKVLVDDTEVIEAPKDAPLVEGGVWLERVTVNFPISHSIEKVAIYRDDTHSALWESDVPVGYLLFQSGLQGTFVDNLRVIDGLSHSYAYAWIDRNGKVSGKSPYSAVVSAKSIDTSVIDKETFKALNEAWTSEFISEGGVADIEKLKADLATQVTSVGNIWGQLSVMQQNYEAIFNKYTLLVNEFNVVSAKVIEQDGSIGNLQSSLKLTADQVATKVTQVDMDAKTSQITNAYTSLFLQNKDYIGSVVSTLNNNATAFSSIGQMNNAIQMKVNANGVVSAINMSPETIQLDGRRIHITGDTLFDKDVRIMQNLYVGGSYNAINGWTDLFNGLKMQWGRFTFSGSSNVAKGRCNFPVGFSNCLSVVLTGNGIANPGWAGFVITVESWDNSGFNWVADTLGMQSVPFVGNIPISFTAIGSK